MKVIIWYIGFVSLIIVLVFTIVMAVRSYTNAATPITVSSPKPGISCALATTSDGVAISCWKE